MALNQQICTPISFVDVFLPLLADMDYAYRKEKNKERQLKLIKYQTLIAIGGYFGPKSNELLNVTWKKIVNKNINDSFEFQFRDSRNVLFSKNFIRLANRNFNLIKPGNEKYLILQKGYNSTTPISVNQFNGSLQKYLKKFDVKTTNYSSYMLRKTHFQYLWELYGADYNAYRMVNVSLKKKSSDEVRSYLGHAQQIVNPTKYRIE